MKRNKFVFVLMAIAVLALFTTAVMLLWNALIPTIFGVGSINYWQALGLFVLARILFGGFSHFGHGKMMRGGMMGHARNPMHEKWRKMTPEQQKAFIDKRRKAMGKFGRFGFEGPFGDNCFHDMHDENDHANNPVDKENE